MCRIESGYQNSSLLICLIHNDRVCPASGFFSKRLAMASDVTERAPVISSALSSEEMNNLNAETEYQQKHVTVFRLSQFKISLVFFHSGHAI